MFSLTYVHDPLRRRFTVFAVLITIGPIVPWVARCQGRALRIGLLIALLGLPAARSLKHAALGRGPHAAGPEVAESFVANRFMIHPDRMTKPATTEADSVFVVPPLYQSDREKLKRRR